VNHQAATTLLCHPVWRKSSRSGGEGQCVEITSTLGHFFVRDSKNPTGPTLACNQTDWSALLSAIKNNKLNLR
jgi:hypothetical protein